MGQDQFLPKLTDLVFDTNHISSIHTSIFLYGAKLTNSLMIPSPSAVYVTHARQKRDYLHLSDEHEQPSETTSHVLANSFVH